MFLILASDSTVDLLEKLIQNSTFVPSLSPRFFLSFLCRRFSDVFPLSVFSMAYYQFSNEFGEKYGSCEIFHMDRFDLQDSGILSFENGEWFSYDHFLGKIHADPIDFEGWYWQACFPGCLPDGDPMGPFPSESEAMGDASVEAS